MFEAKVSECARVIGRNIHKPIQFLHPVPVIGWIPDDHTSQRTFKVEQRNETTSPAGRDDREQLVVFEYQFILTVRVNVANIRVRLLVMMYGPMCSFGENGRVTRVT